MTLRLWHCRVAAVTGRDPELSWADPEVLVSAVGCERTDDGAHAVKWNAA